MATRRTVLCIAAALPLLVALIAPAGAKETRPSPRLTVQGEGAATAEPDLALVTVGVVARAKTAKDALAQNSKAMTEVIAAVKAAGIEARDIKTARVSLSPQYSIRPPGSTAPTTIVGYEARNSARIRVRQLDKLGGALDLLVVSGANEIAGLQLSVAEPEPLLDRARAAAVKDAQRKAALYAEAASLRIKRIVSIAEGTRDIPGPHQFRAAAAPERAAVPIEAGEMEFRARVTVVYEIEPR
jgi:hypothetical protein